jgi:hypothetical protein
MTIYIIIRDNKNNEVLYDSSIIDEYNKNNKKQTQIEFDEILAKDMNKKYNKKKQTEFSLKKYNMSVIQQLKT